MKQLIYAAIFLQLAISLEPEDHINGKFVSSQTDPIGKPNQANSGSAGLTQAQAWPYCLTIQAAWLGLAWLELSC